jgi:hypothetical protein
MSQTQTQSDDEDSGFLKISKLEASVLDTKRICLVIKGYGYIG